MDSKPAVAIKATVSTFKQFVYWMKTSPIAWFGGLFLVFFLLWILNDYLKDKEDVLEKYVTKIRSKEKNGLTGDSKESKGERAAKAAAERIFGKPFIKVRMDKLRNKVTNHNLELDVYNEELSLGIEYSGRQHYEFVPFFHKNYEAFMNQKYRDEIKRMKCKEHDIRLIEIPYTVKIEDIESFIRFEAKKLGYDV